MEKATQEEVNEFAATLSDDDAVMFREMFAAQKFDLIRGHFPGFLSDAMVAEKSDAAPLQSETDTQPLGNDVQVGATSTESPASNSNITEVQPMEQEQPDTVSFKEQEAE